MAKLSTDFRKKIISAFSVRDNQLDLAHKKTQGE